MRYLSQEWLDEGRSVDAGLVGLPGLAARVQYVVTDGPEGDIEYVWIFADGHLAESRLGRIPDPDVTVTLSYADSAGAHRGDIELTDALRRGSITGDHEKLIALRALRSDVGHDRAQAHMRSITEY